MTDNEPPKRPHHSRTSKSKRIAPEHISATPQTQPVPPPPRNPYPFRRLTSADDSDDPDDDEVVSSDRHKSAEETSQRRMWLISNIFFERRINDGATGAPSRHIVPAEPSEEHMHLVPHLISRVFDQSGTPQNVLSITRDGYQDRRRLRLVALEVETGTNGIVASYVDGNGDGGSRFFRELEDLLMSRTSERAGQLARDQRDQREQHIKKRLKQRVRLRRAIPRDPHLFVDSLARLFTEGEEEFEEGGQGEQDTSHDLLHPGHYTTASSQSASTPPPPYTRELGPGELTLSHYFGDHELVQGQDTDHGEMEDNFVDCPSNSGGSSTIPDLVSSTSTASLSDQPFKNRMSEPRTPEELHDNDAFHDWDSLDSWGMESERLSEVTTAIDQEEVYDSDDPFGIYNASPPQLHTPAETEQEVEPTNEGQSEPSDAQPESNTAQEETQTEFRPLGSIANQLQVVSSSDGEGRSFSKAKNKPLKGKKSKKKGKKNPQNSTSRRDSNSQERGSSSEGRGGAGAGGSIASV